MNVSKEWLEEHYLIQNKTAKQIAEELNCSKDTIAHLLSDLGIKKPKLYLDKDWLYEQYIINDRTFESIGNETGMTSGSVRRLAISYGIYKNKEPVYTKDFLYEEHIVKRKSMLQIAHETNHNNTTVRKYMDLYNIPVWTCHDNTNEYIDNQDGTTTIKIYDAYGEYKDSALIDTIDVDKVKKIKWILVKDSIVKDRPRYRVMSGQHPSIVLGRYILNVPNNKLVDHKNNNTLDNTRKNLRVADGNQNQSNHDLHVNNTSGFTGVAFDNNKQKWHAQIKNKGTTYHLGSYTEKCNAVYARYIAEQYLFQEYRSNRNDNNIKAMIAQCHNKENIKQQTISRIEKTQIQKRN